MRAEREAQRAAALVRELASAEAGVAATNLTKREVEVLRLVAQGLSNPVIAERLVLSEHTVHRHLANLLAKLGLSSRAAAAPWRHGTGSSDLARSGHLLRGRKFGLAGRCGWGARGKTSTRKRRPP